MFNKCHTEEDVITYCFNVWSETMVKYSQLHTLEDEIIWLKENCSDINLVKKIFDGCYQEQEFTYDIDNDNIDIPEEDDDDYISNDSEEDEISVDNEPRENTEPLYARIAELEKKNENLKLENENLKKEQVDLWDLVYLSKW
tara:strand:+ start:2191 stop:2616 length:426 start_codon:yes stop_codon:yes gene_type:complete